MAIVSFIEAENIGDRFLALLSSLSIAPPSGSSLENEYLSLTELLDVAKNQNRYSNRHSSDLLRLAAGVHDFSAKILSVSQLPEFKNFVPHLRLIAEKKIPKASFSQNKKGEYDDDTGRKMAELYIACLAAHLGRDVHLDNPNNSKGDNPDIMFTVTHQGERTISEKWAIAVKTISTNKGQTVFDRIKDAAAQIDKPVCTADKGIVVINAKDAIDHDVLWDTRFSSLQCATIALRDQLMRLISKADSNREQEEWDAIFQYKVRRPILFLGQCIVRVPTVASSQTPTELKIFLPYDARGQYDYCALGIANCLNHNMQAIVRGYSWEVCRHPVYFT